METLSDNTVSNTLCLHDLVSANNNSVTLSNSIISANIDLTPTICSRVSVPSIYHHLHGSSSVETATAVAVAATATSVLGHHHHHEHSNLLTPNFHNHQHHNHEPLEKLKRSKFVLVYLHHYKIN